MFPIEVYAEKYADKTVKLRLVYKFPNGYGASVIRGPGTYGNKQGLWELAVLDSTGGLCYDTPITGDVLGHLTPEEVSETLCKIAAL